MENISLKIAFKTAKKQNTIKYSQLMNFIELHCTLLRIWNKLIKNDGWGWRELLLCSFHLVWHINSSLPSIHAFLHHLCWYLKERMAQKQEKKRDCHAQSTLDNHLSCYQWSCNKIIMWILCANFIETIIITTYPCTAGKIN